MRIIYFDIDTLRPDHLGCYGYHRDTSPNIDALAAAGTRFDNVYASDVPCLPSRTALITGRFGIQTGVVNHGGRGANLDLAPEGAQRSFLSELSVQSWAARFFWKGYRTASFSSFPIRHAATWWTVGFQEMIDASRGMGGETADRVVPDVLGWIDRHGREDHWFCHVHLWDPHTPYNTPPAFGNPFEGDPIPAWYTEDVRARHWGLPGPHSAQEPFGFRPDEFGDAGARQPIDLADLPAVKVMFDGYDVGIRYADDHVGRVLSKLDEVSALDDTLVMVASDHGEGFGELGVYADHQAADEATAHIPMILRGPGVPVGVDRSLHYHLDVGATVTELAGATPPAVWDGTSFAAALRDGREEGREFLVTSQGAWSCQRGLRTGDHLYLRTMHSGYHDWADEMLFDLSTDPHEQHDLAGERPELVMAASQQLDRWITEQLAASVDHVDPLVIVMAEGGPFHTRGRLRAYLERLRTTGRGQWADLLAERYAADLDVRPAISDALIEAFASLNPKLAGKLKPA
ncbi:MAG TPA: sulfatase [Acidimicrobiales bacterium]|jgi:arylsulfatase A-like enzyme|nr:sulfatase [Acidimicrobiales bacterium]